MTSNPELIRTLLELEQRLFQPDVRHSRRELEGLLAENFIEIGSSGRICDRETIIKGLGREKGIQITLSDFGIRLLTPEIALATYLAVISDTTSKKTAHSIRSSIWKKTAGHWRMPFHQGTPVREPI